MTSLGAEERRLVERAADELEAHRQAVVGLAGGHRDARQAGHVDRHREDVVEVHLDRRGQRHRFQPEGGGRRRRRQDGVDAVGEDLSKSRLISVRTRWARR